MSQSRQAFRVSRLLVLGSVLVLLQCTWFRSEPESGVLIKPTPVGGYEQLSLRIHYPKSIRDKGIEGELVVKARISKTGAVDETRVASRLDPVLDKIAENAIRRTLFNPAMQNGEPREVWIAIPLVFALENYTDRTSPFETFECRVYPDEAYRNFEIRLQGQLKADQTLPLRFEILLPYNADKVWIIDDGQKQSPEQVRDENGEWAIFQVNTPDFAMVFNYHPINTQDTKTFQYKLMLNQSLPDWDLSVVYAGQNVRFNENPDEILESGTGETIYRYKLDALEAYDARYLEVALEH